MTNRLIPYRDMTVAELRDEHARTLDLLSHALATDTRESLTDCLAIITTWIARREREAAEAKEGVAA